MELKAKALGIGGSLKYVFPHMGNNASALGLDVAAVAASLQAIGIDAQIATDLHTWGGGPLGESSGVDIAHELFRDVDVGNTSLQGAINLETNYGSHNMGRALAEAADLNAFFAVNASTQARLWARTASFCTERSGHFDDFDQGMSFFLPNMSWLQPPGHVHAMIAKSWLPIGVPTVAKPDPTAKISWPEVRRVMTH